VKITVQFFSHYRQWTGHRELSLELPAGATVADAFAQFPTLHAARASTLVAVGVEFAKWDAPLRDGDVVAFMPPVQGGAAEELTLTDQPIPDLPLRQLSGAVGAVVIFWGVVRDREDGAPITALDYTAYRAMAEHQFRQLLAETKQRWPLRQLRVIHRLGVVPVGEPSLVVRVEAGHRAEAFAAAQFLIDELKQRVPIWKAPVRPTSSPETAA
jgi:molybdopterin synthase catalytic subunit